MTEQNDSGQIDQGAEPLEDDDIIELTDIVTQPAAEDEDAVDLVEVVEESVSDAPSEEDAEASDELEAFSLDYELDESMGLDEDADDFVDSLGMDLDEEDVDIEESDAPMSETDAADGPLPPISTEQIEAALERVIENRLSDRIEQIINEVLERAVTKEMDRLRDIFSEGFSGEE